MSFQAPEPLPDDLQRAVDLYAERLTELLVSCAEHQLGDPEVFLWNARRVLEAMVLLLMSVHERKVMRLQPDVALYKLINQLEKRDVLSREDEIRFQRAREYANLGVHISKPEREDYKKARDDLGHLLPGMVDWLYEESVAAPYLRRTADLVNAVIDIRQGGRREPTAPALPLPAPPPPPRSSRRLWLPPALAAASLVVSAAVSYGMLDSTDSTESAPPLAAAAFAPVGTAAAERAVADEPPEEPTAEPEPEPVGLAEEEAPAVDEDAATPPPDCPAGMVGVASRTVRLGQPQPDRKDWPAPWRASLPPVPVGGFCIDARERSLAEVAEFARSQVQPVSDCDWRTAPDGPEAAAVCLDRDEAAAYCAQALPGGRLPTLAEWESLERSPQARQVRTEVRREWVADAFPPAVLARAWPADGEAHPAEGLFRQKLRGEVDAEGNLLHSWNRQEVGNRWRNLGFRCATEPR